MKLLYLRRQLLIAGTIYIGQMLVGYVLGWTAPIIPKLQDEEQSPLHSAISERAASWTGSLIYVGAIIGPHVTGYLSNIIGRKPCLLIGGAIIAISFIIIILTRDLAMLFTSRILQGFGAGIILVLHLVYIGEIASTGIRGILLTVIGIAGSLGTLIIYSVGPYISYAGTGWLGLGLTIVYVAAVCFIPESPVYRVLKGDETEAKKTLLTLGRADEIPEVLATKIKVKSDAAEWKEIFTVKSNKWALIITLTLGILQHMSGAYAVVFFATSIFEMTGSSVTPHVATIIIGVTQLAASSITPFFVDWTGRKTLLLFSTAVCSMSLTVLGIYFYLLDIQEPFVDRIAWVPLVTLIMFFLAYGLGFGVIPATFTGEMFRANVRAPGSAVVITTAWLVGFGVTTGFGSMISALGGHFTFWLFAGFCAVAFFFTLALVPETKGKTLIEIQEMLS